MRKQALFEIDDITSFKKKLLAFAGSFSRACVLESNEWKGSANEMMVAFDSVDEIIANGNFFESLKKIHKEKKDWLFGFLSYDSGTSTPPLLLKEKGAQFPSMHFFQPKYVFFLGDNKVEIHFLSEVSSHREVENIFEEILSFPSTINPALPAGPPAERAGRHQLSAIEITQRISEQEYIQAIKRIKNHIQRGDIYEMNFCMEFFSEEAEINPEVVFERLNKTSRAPFSAFYRMDDNYLLCASPERFLKKEGKKIISQPIKGTARRGKTILEDNELKDLLLKNNKDRSENVMIVDLVRNDLSRTCSNVNVEELFGIYTFAQWHQMISTVSGEIKDDVHFADVIENAFPMGSMTGAPKIRAMELIERYEKTKRGLYSGAVGYITPEGDFDFNVVIRSILYNSSSKYLSFSVGSAITAHSIPENEYEECLLKAKGMFAALSTENPKSEKTNPKEYKNSLV